MRTGPQGLGRAPAVTLPPRVTDDAAQTAPACTGPSEPAVPCRRPVRRHGHPRGSGIARHPWADAFALCTSVSSWEEWGAE